VEDSSRVQVGLCELGSQRAAGGMYLGKRDKSLSERCVRMDVGGR
jgi:hypothetical protein